MSAVVLATVALSAYSEEKKAVLEEVIVTAQKRQEKLQDVPIAITAMTSQELQAKGITDFKGVLQDTPSIYTSPFILSSTGTLVVAMRGVGSDNPSGASSESAVGLYRDGFYMARGQAVSFDLADIERVEVLRGPQGTLYGRNTDGGAINVISKKPTGEFGVKQDLSFGSRNEFRSLTSVNLPAWHDVATKFTALKSSTDGFVKNPGASHDFGEEGRRAGRFDLRWTPGSTLSADYFVETGRGQSTPLFFQNPGQAGTTITYNSGAASYTYPVMNGPARVAPRSFDLPLSTFSSTGTGLTLAWNVNDALTIKSLTGYFKLDTVTNHDYADVAGFPLTEHPFLQNHQFSQELQFIGNLLDHRLSYVAGLYYFKEQSASGDTLMGDFGVPLMLSQAVFDEQNKSTAAYGQVTWTPPLLDDRLDLTLGARYTRDTRDGTDVTLPNAFDPSTTSSSWGVKSHKFTPAFTANYRWTEDLSTYAKVATGFLAGKGGFTPGVGEFTQKPESLTSYELGLKSYWLDHRVRLNLAAYVSKYKDKQVAIGSPSSTPGLFRFVPTNIGRSTIKGVEVELLSQLMDDVTLGLNYSYLDNHVDYVPVIAGGPYDSAVNPLSPYSAGGNIAGTFATAPSPKNSAGLNGDYTFLHFDQSTLTVHLEYRYQSYVDQQGPLIPNYRLGRLPSYGVLNGRLTWTGDLSHGERAKVSLWAKNLTQKNYRLLVANTGGNGLAVATSPGDTVGVTGKIENWAPPRSYGIDFTYEFE